MLINLSDVLTTEGGRMKMEVPLEMSCFESGAESFEILEKSPVSLTFTNVEPHKARVEGNVNLTLRADCDRCLAETTVDLQLCFDRLAASPEAVQEDEEIDDLSFMEGCQLDVETFVRNEIMGNWPAKILCREDCKGICPKCGKDLNMGDCGCDTFVPDPRMAVIQDIFNAKREV